MHEHTHKHTHSLFSEQVINVQVQLTSKTFQLFTLIQTLIQTRGGNDQSGIRFPSTLIFTACPDLVKRRMSANRRICLSTRDKPFFMGPCRDTHSRAQHQRVSGGQHRQTQVKLQKVSFSSC